jgi:hypothetical protein
MNRLPKINVSLLNIRTWGYFVLVLLPLWASNSCRNPAAHPDPPVLSNLVDKKWNVTQYQLKVIIGMVYKNKPQLEKEAAAYLQSGVSWVFGKDGKLTVTEGTEVYEGNWQLDPGRQAINAVFQKNQQEVKMVFEQIYLTENTFSANLHYPKVSYSVAATAP